MLLVPLRTQRERDNVFHFGELLDIILQLLVLCLPFRLLFHQ